MTWFTAADCRLEDFRALVEQTTDPWPTVPASWCSGARSRTVVNPGGRAQVAHRD
jgi:hypothetical protein